jgi:hypothetical protein
MIGLGLTLIHLIGIPVTNLSVNPARSTGPTVFVEGWALAQLWLFWIPRSFVPWSTELWIDKSYQLRTSSSWLSIVFNIAACHVGVGDRITKFVVEESMPCVEPRS